MEQNFTKEDLRLRKHNWMSLAQLEREQLISKALALLSPETFLTQRLIFRGGEAIQKLYLPFQTRCCDTLCFSQKFPEPIKATCDALRDCLSSFDVKPRFDSTKDAFIFYFRYYSSVHIGMRYQWRLEIMTRDHSIHGTSFIKKFHHSDKAAILQTDVSTYQLEELISQCLLQLLSRSRGRDLIDILAALESGITDNSLVRELMRVKASDRGLDTSVLKAGEWWNRKWKDRYFRNDFCLSDPSFLPSQLNARNAIARTLDL